jgi:DNA polymerase IV
MQDETPEPVQRIVAHMDMDTFFVSVERLLNSQLNGVPLLIGGSSERGVVASCSYETRKFGVRSGMPMRQARTLCPEAVVLRGDFQQYAEHSNLVRQIVAEAVPVLEFASIDEFYLDLTGMDKFFGAWKFAKEIRQKVMRETGLALSLGQANCKAVAKISTGEAKPCGTLQIARGMERAFMAPMPIRKIPGAGSETCKLLHAMGLDYIQTLQQMPVEALEDVLGANGRSLWLKAQAADPTPVIPYSERKSIGHEETFERDTTDTKLLNAVLTQAVEKLAFQLRQSNKLTACVTVKIRYTNFDTETKQQRIPYTAQDEPLLDLTRQLFRKLFNRRMLVRLVGVSFSHLVHGGVQLSLFEDRQEKANLLRASDYIRKKYGASSLKRADGIIPDCSKG